jgi:hypothetical protein
VVRKVLLGLVAREKVDDVGREGVVGEVNEDCSRRGKEAGGTFRAVHRHQERLYFTYLSEIISGA